MFEIDVKKQSAHEGVGSVICKLRRGAVNVKSCYLRRCQTDRIVIAEKTLSSRLTPPVLQQKETSPNSA